MSWIETILTRVEAQLRMVVEGDSTRNGFPKKLHHQLAQGLVQAMKAGVSLSRIDVPLSAQTAVAPDLYTLVLPAIEAQVLLAHPNELDRLTHLLENVATQASLAFTSSPMLRVVGDPQAVEASIQASFSQPGEGASHTYQLHGESIIARNESNGRLPNAFLIVNGLATFPITMPIVNIGRDASNHLRLDDVHLSPYHAQLRFVQGQFVIFDLDSRGGTYVNGLPVSRHTLKPGDVIQLSGIPLVYGQDSVKTGTQTQELPVDPPPPEVL